MKKYIIYLFIIPMLTLLCACSEDTIDSDGSGSLKGTVIEQGTNEPIENVKVKIVASNTAVLTDANGEFSISNISATT